MKKSMIIFVVLLLVLISLVFFVKARMVETASFANTEGEGVATYDNIVRLEEGWNLVTGFSVESFKIRKSNDIQDSDISISYAYVPVSGNYVLTNPKLEEELEKLGDLNTREIWDVSNSAMWIYSEKAGDITYKTWHMISLNRRSIYEGWNLLSITPDVMDTLLFSKAGTCSIEQSYFWDSIDQKWVKFPFYAPRDFSWHGQSILGYGLALKVSSNCALGTVDVATPPLIATPSSDEPDGTTTPIITPTPEGGSTPILSTEESIEVMVGSETHHVSIQSVSETEATIVIESEPIIVTLSIGEEFKADVNNDGYYDVYVKLLEIVETKAEINVQEIYEEIPGQIQEETPSETTPETPAAAPPVEETALPDWWYPTTDKYDEEVEGVGDIFEEPEESEKVTPSQEEPEEVTPPETTTPSTTPIQEEQEVISPQEDEEDVSKSDHIEENALRDIIYYAVYDYFSEECKQRKKAKRIYGSKEDCHDYWDCIAFEFSDLVSNKDLEYLSEFMESWGGERGVAYYNARNPRKKDEVFDLYHDKCFFNVEEDD